MGTDGSRSARALFEALLVRDGHLEAVQPRQEFQPYLMLAEAQEPVLDDEELALSDQSSIRRSRGDSGPRLPYGGLAVYAIRISAPLETRHKLLPAVWPELVARSQTRSLRQLAREYGVSHEAVRGALRAATVTPGA